jgi:hypothetical protein
MKFLNLCKLGEPSLHREPNLLKNRNNTAVDLKNFKSCGGTLV